MRSGTLGCLLALGVFAAALPAAQPDSPSEKPAQPAPQPLTLKVGDAAPPLSVENWVKGEPVAALETGRIYVVEFWSTWCGPCIVAIPHLNQLHQKYEGKVRLIAVSASDRDLATVENFVREQGDKMAYAVAFDADRSMTDTWLAPAGRSEIPCSFVIGRDGKIAWIGHPRVGLDVVLAKVVAGNFNPAAWARTEAAAEELRVKALHAVQAEDYQAAAKALDELAGLDSAFAADAGLMKFRMFLMQKKDYPAAYAAATALYTGPLKDDPVALKEIAFTILEGDGVEERNIDLAMKIAHRAVEIGRGDEALIIDTLARAYWIKGDKAKAIEWQRAAIAKASNPVVKRELEVTLAKYETQ